MRFDDNVFPCLVTRLRVRFPAQTGMFSLRRRVQISYGAYTASYPVGIGGQAAGA